MLKPQFELDTRTEHMVRVATMYYVDNYTQDQIAKKLHLSRIKVGRLLKRARQEGIVEINVRPHPSLNFLLENALAQRFGLKRALLAVDTPDSHHQRASVAKLVASFLSYNLRDGMTVAVGMGRNCGALADYVFNPSRHKCTFVSAMGGSPKAGEPFNPDHICRRLAERFGGWSESLYAPAYVANRRVRDAIIRQDDVRTTLEHARQSDITIVGLGEISPNANVVKMGCISPAEMAKLASLGSVGDILGCDFDISGRVTPKGMVGRVIGLTVDDLKNVPTVIAIAGERTKTLSILGALRLGVIDILATTVHNAQAVLDLDSQQSKG